MPSADFCSAVRPPFDSLSRRSDTKQISWGKLSRLLCTAAGSTLRAFDGYGLRGKLPARPALAPISGFCPSTRTFDPCFFQTPPRDGSPCIITRPSPPSGWPEDLHLQAAEHAQHTTKPLPRRTLRVGKGCGLLRFAVGVGHKEVPVTQLRIKVLEELKRRNYSEATATAY